MSKKYSFLSVLLSWLLKFYIYYFKCHVRIKKHLQIFTRLQREFFLSIEINISTLGKNHLVMHFKRQNIIIPQKKRFRTVMYSLPATASISYWNHIACVSLPHDVWWRNCKTHQTISHWEIYCSPAFLAEILSNPLYPLCCLTICSLIFSIQWNPDKLSENFLAFKILCHSHLYNEYQNTHQKICRKLFNPSVPLDYCHWSSSWTKTNTI